MFREGRTVWYGDKSPLVGSRGKALVGGLAQKLKQFAGIVTDFDYRSDQNLKISYNSPPDSSLVCFMEAKQHLWGLALLPTPGSASG